MNGAAFQAAAARRLLVRMQRGFRQDGVQHGFACCVGKKPSQSWSGMAGVCLPHLQRRETEESHLFLSTRKTNQCLLCRGGLGEHICKKGRAHPNMRQEKWPTLPGFLAHGNTQLLYVGCQPTKSSTQASVIQSCSPIRTENSTDCSAAVTQRRGCCDASCAVAVARGTVHRLPHPW